MNLSQSNRRGVGIHLRLRTTKADGRDGVEESVCCGVGGSAQGILQVEFVVAMAPVASDVTASLTAKSSSTRVRSTEEGEDVRAKDVYRVRSANDVTLSSFEGACNGNDNHQSGLYKTQ